MPLQILEEKWYMLNNCCYACRTMAPPVAACHLPKKLPLEMFIIAKLMQKFQLCLLVCVLAAVVYNDERTVYVLLN